MNQKIILTAMIAIIGVGYIVYTGQECNIQCMLDFMFKVDDIVDEIVE